VNDEPAAIIGHLDQRWRFGSSLNTKRMERCVDECAETAVAATQSYRSLPNPVSSRKRMRRQRASRAENTTGRALSIPIEYPGPLPAGKYPFEQHISRVRTH